MNQDPWPREWSENNIKQNHISNKIIQLYLLKLNVKKKQQMAKESTDDVTNNVHILQN